MLDFVTILQEELIRAEVFPADYDFEAHKKLVPMQPGDVPITYADTSALERDYGFKPNTSLRDGLHKFAEWYKEFYKNILRKEDSLTNENEESTFRQICRAVIWHI